MRLIYADTLKEAMIGACNIFEKRGIDTMIARAVISIIDAIAGVDAEPVRYGRWIETTIPANTTGHGGMGQDKTKGWLCSNCRCAFDAKLLWCDNYCPNCGADMRDGGKINVE